MPAHLYDSTVEGLMGWARAELWHVGEITGMRDKDLQYSYALSTANSMAHLHDAFSELLTNPLYARHHPDLIKTHAVVLRALKDLVRRYRINVDSIKKFNTRHVLSDLSYLKQVRKTRKNKKRRSES
jgi:hypothetical protein